MNESAIPFGLRTGRRAAGPRTPLLIVMAKAPAYGLGKTRLARSLGKSAALRINRALHRATFAAAAAGPWRVCIAIAPASARGRCAPGLWPAKTLRYPQRRGDLTAKLLEAALYATRTAPLAPFAFIGTDCPDLSAAAIHAGFRALARAPLSVGPTTDGGFWMLAARAGAFRRLRRAFKDVRWSSAHTLADIRRNLDATPGALATVRTLADIDDEDDYRRWRTGRSLNRRRF